MFPLLRIQQAAALGALALLLGLAAGTVLGYRYADAQGAKALSDLQRRNAEEQVKGERAARLELVAAQRVGDALTERLAEAQSRRTVKTVEVIRAIPKHTDGRACLNAGAVRLLDDALQPDFAALPKTAGEPVKPPAALAASDADVAGWIAEAGRLYAACAGRLNALIDWEMR